MNGAFLHAKSLACTYPRSSTNHPQNGGDPFCGRSNVQGVQKAPDKISWNSPPLPNHVMHFVSTHLLK